MIFCNKTISKLKKLDRVLTDDYFGTEEIQRQIWQYLVESVLLKKLMLSKRN